ncbi:hypothetical protein VV02_06860 [Luteipulveratus mongoliensis]|uniref:Sugar ABC transporter substrate-binding protein n=1 Tax=Luteipulveratus mongoliensis TaxID=571913 RepID=A0A0K1JQ52_9MICO|nr:hypothetical protein VV02_06860 [Luteipulveratus mongoliensis]
MHPARRDVLRAGISTAALVALGSPLLAACGGSDSAAAGKARASTVKPPTYVPFAGPKPDLAGTSQGVPPAYLTYPKDLVRSVPKPPLSGGTVKVLTTTFTPLPTPRGGNAAWKEVEKRLGGTLDLTIVSDSDYLTKFPTTVAAGDLPDVFLYEGGLKNLPQFLKASCADLTPHLSGDAVKAYPNLAHIPTVAWETCIIDDKIYGLPIPRDIVGGSGFYNAKHFADAGVEFPTNATEFMAAMKKLTNAKKGRWGIVNAKGNTIMTPVSHMFGVPNVWRVEGGKLVRSFETPEYKEAIAFARQLVQAGVTVPGSDAFTTIQRKNAFNAGKGSFVYDGLPAYREYAIAAKHVDPKADIRPALMPGAKGGTAKVWADNIVLAYSLVKKGSPERIKEILKVADFLAAPVGSEESQLLVFGVEGVDFTRDAKGNPSLTKKGEADMTVPWKNVVAGPRAVFFDNDPELARRVHQTLSTQIPTAVADPTAALISPTYDKKNESLTSDFNDTKNDIIAGRKPLSALDGAIKKWRNGGGDKIRAEFEKALSAGSSPSATS